jgi:hypothetical protein
MSDAHAARITHSALQQDYHKGGTARHVEARGCAICIKYPRICTKKLKNYTSVRVVILQERDKSST